MKTVVAAFGVVLIPFAAFSQGSLTPPGVPAPTMRTLEQIEPRTPISSLPYTITASGSYYLTTNLPSATAGIIIEAHSVTVDLMGFELGGGTGNGVLVSNTRSNICVRNGTARGWTQSGINLQNCAGGRVENMHACKNGGNGISVGNHSLVRNCVTVGNGSVGIFANPRSMVTGCIANENASHGIRTFGQCFILNNNAHDNGTSGTGAGVNVATDDSRVEGNNVSFNRVGILANDAGNLIIRNSASGNTTNYHFTGTQTFGPTNAVTGEITSENPWRNFSY